MIPVAPIIAGIASVFPVVLDLLPDADPVKARARRIGQLEDSIATLTGKLAGDLRPARRIRLSGRLAGAQAELAELRKAEPVEAD